MFRSVTQPPLLKATPLCCGSSAHTHTRHWGPSRVDTRCPWMRSARRASTCKMVCIRPPPSAGVVGKLVGRRHGWVRAMQLFQVQQFEEPSGCNKLFLLLAQNSR